MPTYRAALLDVDGTLVDSNDLHAEAWHQTLVERGYPVTFAKVRALIGVGSDKLVPILTEQPASSERGQALIAERSRRFREQCLPRVQPFPQARELVLRMKETGLRLVVASSASRDELEGLLERGGLLDVLTDRTSSDDAERSKPSPDILQVALAKARAQADEAVMLGDTPYDVEAAARAGVACIALRSGGWNDDTLRGALAIYEDPRELLERYVASPLAIRRD